MGNQPPTSGGGEAHPRPPTLNDLALLGAELNRLGAQYVVVGGWAIVQAGYPRLTEDVDLLVATDPENEARVIQALLILPDRAAAELKPGEIAQYGVVRVADELLVDLMKSGCGVTYAEAIRDAVYEEVDGVSIPFASPQTLWRMKQTVREKDIPDRLFLRQWHAAHGLALDPPLPEPTPPPDQPLSRVWQRLKSWWRNR